MKEQYFEKTLSVFASAVLPSGGITDCMLLSRPVPPLPERNLETQPDSLFENADFLDFFW